jgi:glycosyltransferase involved in cell wall biosynthesis
MPISLIIPAYNEEQRLVPFLATVIEYLQRHPQDIQEIIVVDDGSTDKTRELVGAYQAQNDHLKVMHHPRNRGKGAAIQTGVAAAHGDQLIFIDADGATPITELPKLIAALRSADIAIGNRWLPGAQTERHSPLRLLSGWVYRHYMMLFGLGKIDTMCGFKGYQRPVAQDLFKNLHEERWLFDTEIAYKAQQRGYSIANVPITWTSQDGSKLSTFTLLKSALKIWPLIQRLKHAK